MSKNINQTSSLETVSISEFHNPLSARQKMAPEMVLSLRKRRCRDRVRSEPCAEQQDPLIGHFYDLDNKDRILICHRWRFITRSRFSRNKAAMASTPWRSASQERDTGIHAIDASRVFAREIRLLFPAVVRLVSAALPLYPLTAINYW